LVLLQQ